MGILQAWSRVVLLVTISACGGPQTGANLPGPPAGGDAGPQPSASAPPPPVEHPFAKTAADATSLIQSDLDTRMKGMWKCVDAKRTRAQNPHLYVVVNIGIDQEGTLIGVSALKQADTDEVLNRCIMEALDRAPWPKSHAGIITVKQEFNDKPIYPE
jgi:hypothetical protein